MYPNLPASIIDDYSNQNRKSRPCCTPLPSSKPHGFVTARPCVWGASSGLTHRGIFQETSRELLRERRGVGCDVVLELLDDQVQRRHHLIMAERKDAQGEGHSRKRMP